MIRTSYKYIVAVYDDDILLFKLGHNIKFPKKFHSVIRFTRDLYGYSTKFYKRSSCNYILNNDVLLFQSSFERYFETYTIEEAERYIKRIISDMNKDKPKTNT